MIKTLKYIALSLSMLSLGGCTGFLDIDQDDYLDTDYVFQSEAAIEAFFATAYTTLPVEDFNFADGYFSMYAGTAYNTVNGWGAECRGNILSETYSTRTWDVVFTNIRYSNILIQNLPTSTVLTEKEIAELVGEARYLRAFSYYFLARYWGGVPIIEEPIEYNTDETYLKRGRDQESDVWDFIVEDLNYAIDNMSSTEIYGRANRNVALAFKSRACLYAASIAKYGTYQPEYCTGINSERALYFYQECMAAAKELIESGKYSLFSEYDDPTENFVMLFQDSQNNSEVILAKSYDYASTSRTHSYDAISMPHQLIIEAGEYQNPYLECVEAFEFADGRAAESMVSLTSGVPTTFSSLAMAFGYADVDAYKRDPRLAASIVLPDSELLGETITIQDGVLCDGVQMTGNDYGLYFDTVSELFVTEKNDNCVRGTGLSGGSNIQTTGTGFFIRKYIDIDLDEKYRVPWSSQTDYIIIRLAEVYLNYVEAAVEADTDLSVALEYLNTVKRRAGVAEFTSTAQLEMDRILAERRSELYFEGFRYWDMIRRRTLLDEFNVSGNLARRTGIEIYYDYESNLYSVERSGSLKSYAYDETRMYYQTIPSTEMAKHNWPNNPGY
ncbi:MAG: RagB/SusD family nutrient uptake outer membrane protein [Rikenellaceae bacterium]